jgi:hypothetical protein
MTTLTTASGMFPLALGIGEGSELKQPLAVAVVGGLAVSMLLTLFVVPSAYMILNTNAERLMAWLTGAQLARTSEVATSAPADAVPHGVPEVAGAD